MLDDRPDHRNADRRRERALARLTTSIAGDLATGRSVSFAKRQEYNSLCRKLGREARLI